MKRRWVRYEVGMIGAKMQSGAKSTDPALTEQLARWVGPKAGAAASSLAARRAALSLRRGAAIFVPHTQTAS